MDNEINKLYLLSKFKEAFERKEWGEVRLIFSFIKISFPREAAILLERMTKEERGFIEL